MFIPFIDKCVNELTAIGLSNLFKNAIKQAYISASTELCKEFKINLHQARLLSHSLGRAFNVPLETVLQNGHWAHHSTFTDFYLRSMSVFVDDLYSLGPLVVSGQAVNTCL